MTFRNQRANGLHCLRSRLALLLVAFGLALAPLQALAGAPAEILRTESPHAQDPGGELAYLTAALPDGPLERLVAELITVQEGSYTFILEPTSVRSSSYTVLKQVSGGSFQSHTPPAETTYRGTVLEIPGSRAAASVLDDGLYALIIVPDDDDLYVQPTSASASSTAPPGSYSVLSLPLGAELQSISPFFTAVAAQSTAGVDDCAVDGLCVAELALDSTYSTYNVLGSDVDAVVEMAEGATNILNLRFEDQLSISHRLTGVTVRTSSSDDPYVNCQGTGCGPLAVLNTEWYANPCSTPICALPKDHVHLLGGGVGTAVWGGLCDNTNARSFSSMANLGAGPLGRFIHEMGHAWDANHNNTCPGIMDPTGRDANFPFCGASLTEIASRRDLLAGLTNSCLDEIIPDPLIFADGFESGDLDGWPVAFDPDERLEVVSGSEALYGSYSLEVDVNPGDPAWVKEELATLEDKYKVRFHLDASGMLGSLLGDPTGPALRIYEATAPDGTAVAWLELRRINGLVPLEMRLSTRLDGGSVTSGSWTGVADLASGEAEVIVRWLASSADGADDGKAVLKVAGTVITDLTGLDNEGWQVDSARLGLVDAAGVNPKPAILVMDGFEARTEDSFGSPL